MKENKQSQIKHSEEYLAFLKKRIESKNYKSNVSPEEFEKTKPKQLNTTKKEVYRCTICRSEKQKNPTVYKIIKPGCEHNWVQVE